MSNSRSYIRTLIVTTCTITVLMTSLPHPVTAAQAVMEYLLDNIEQCENFWDTLDTRFAHSREIPQDNSGISMVSLTFEHTENADDLWTFHITQDNQSGDTRVGLIQDGVLQ